MDMLVAANLLRRRNAPSFAKTAVEDRYYQTHYPGSPRLFSLLAITAIVAVDNQPREPHLRWRDAIYRRRSSEPLLDHPLIVDRDGDLVVAIDDPTDTGGFPTNTVEHDR